MGFLMLTLVILFIWLLFSFQDKKPGIMLSQDVSLLLAQFRGIFLVSPGMLLHFHRANLDVYLYSYVFVLSLSLDLLLTYLSPGSHTCHLSVVSLPFSVCMVVFCIASLCCWSYPALSFGGVNGCSFMYALIRFSCSSWSSYFLSIFLIVSSWLWGFFNVFRRSWNFRKFSCWNGLCMQLIEVNISLLFEFYVASSLLGVVLCDLYFHFYDLFFYLIDLLFYSEHL